MTAEDGSTATYTVTVNVTPEQSGEAEIISFVLGELDPPVDSDIDEDNNITATVPARTDLTALVPTIVISEDATISPASGAAQDFTEPVTYTVTAEDGTTQEYTVTITPTISAVWEKNLNAGGLPDFFTANNEREIAAYGDFVYVQTNNDKIRILNRATGEEIDTDNFFDGTENFEGGNIFANLLGMDVDDAGNIVASTGALADGDFRIYRWDEDSTQELLLEGTYPARLGDNITVVGDVTETAIIYAPGVGTNKIYRFTVLDGVGNNVPQEITAPTVIGNGADINLINGRGRK